MFAQHGAKVLLTDSNAALGKSVAKEITDSGGTATFATQDVRDDAQWAAAVAQAEKSYGRLDILCNIAGISGRDPKLNIQTSVTAGPRLAEQTLEQWNLVMESMQRAYSRHWAAIAAMQRAGGGSSSTSRRFAASSARTPTRPITRQREPCGSSPRPPRSNTRRTRFA
jgi:NAD(P)-dependent dehydrogenase (short-subunit alcohol dehydrogenase family)